MPPQRPSVTCTHLPPAGFRPGSEVALTVRLDDPTRPESVTCWYRRVNQAERFQSIEMEREGQAFHTIIPASYTASPYPLQYYFLVRLSRDRGRSSLVSAGTCWNSPTSWFPPSSSSDRHGPFRKTTEIR